MGLPHLWLADGTASRRYRPARLHEQGEHPLSQSLCFDAAAQTSVWTLNLLDEALAAQVRPLLADCTTLELHGALLQMEPLAPPQRSL